MTLQREYMAVVPIQPSIKFSNHQNKFYPEILNESPQIYCIGGKGKFLLFKTIEKFIVSENRWVEVKMQLNYSRYFPSCCQFNNTFIYIFGKSDKETEMIEVMDVRLEQTNIKCDLISLSMHSEPTNWFKQIIIPV